MRTSYVHFRASAAEMLAVRALADREGVGMSEFLRLLIRRELERRGVTAPGLATVSLPQIEAGGGQDE